MSEDLDDFDFDDDLDFDMELGDTNADVDGKSRKPIVSLLSGAKETLLDPETSVSVAEGLIENALPSKYSSLYEETMSVKDEFTSSMALQLKKIQPEAAGFLGDVRTFLPKGKLNAFLKKQQDSLTEDTDAYTPKSDKERESEEISEALNGIFDQQIDLTAKSITEDSKNTLIDRKLNLAAHKDNVDYLRIIAQSASQDVAYTTKVTASYQRKSLELRYKSFFLLKDLLSTTKTGILQSEKQREALLLNTGLPENAKIKIAERTSAVGKGRAAHYLYDRLYDGATPLGVRMATMKDTLQKNISEKITGATGIAGSIGDIASAKREMAELEAEGLSVDKYKEGASLTTGMLTGMLTEKFGDLLTRYTEKSADGEESRVGDLLNKAGVKVDNFKDTLYSKIDQYTEYNIDDGKIKERLREAGGVVKEALYGEDSSDISFMDTSSVNTEGFDHDAKNSLITVIPGLLSRILRETTMIRTGDSDIPLTTYDNSSMKWRTERSSKTLVDKGLKVGLRETAIDDGVDDAYNSLVSDKDKLTPEAQTAVRTMLTDLNFRGLDGERTITSLKGLSLNADKLLDGVDDATKEEVKKLLAGKDKSMSDSDKLKLHARLETTIKQLPDGGSLIKSFIKQGRVDDLIALGVLSRTPDGKSFILNKKVYKNYILGTESYAPEVDDIPTTDTTTTADDVKVPTTVQEAEIKVQETTAEETKPPVETVMEEVVKSNTEQVDVLLDIKESLAKEKRSFNDSDKDGDRDGSFKDRMANMRKKKKEKEKEASVDNSVAKNTAIAAGGGLLSLLAGAASVAGGVMNTAGAVASTGIKAGASMYGLSKVSSFFSKGAKGAKPNKSLLRRAGGMAVKGSATLAKVGIKTAVSPLSKLGLPGTMIAGMVSIVELLNGSEYLSGIKRNDLTNLRNAQYGLERVDLKLNYGRVALLEDYINNNRSSFITWRSDKPMMDLARLDHDVIADIFAVEIGTNFRWSNLLIWLQHRFAPVYLAHLYAMSEVNDTKDFRKIEYLNPKERTLFLPMVKVIDDNKYLSVSASPFPEVKYLEGINSHNKIQAAFAITLKYAQDPDPAYYDSQGNKRDSRDTLERIREERLSKKRKTTIGIYSDADMSHTEITTRTDTSYQSQSLYSSIMGKKGSYFVDKAKITTTYQTRNMDEAISKDEDYYDNEDAIKKLNPNVDIDGLHPLVRSRLLGMAAEYLELTGNLTRVTSAKRSTKDQARLRKKRGKFAAKGISMHELGYAIDIKSADLGGMDKLGLLRKWGFTRPVSSEKWHIEPAGLQMDIARSRKDLEFANKAIAEYSLGRGGGGIGSTNLKSDGPHRDYKMAMDAMGPSAPTNKAYLLESLDRSPSQNAGDVISMINEGPGNVKDVLRRTVVPFKDANDVSTKEGVKQLVTAAANKAGIDPDMYKLVIAQESGFNTSAESGKSSAQGLAQFTDGTWKEQVAKYAEQYGFKKDVKRSDAKASAMLGALYMRDNLKNLPTGHDNSPASAYLTHFLGPTGAKQFLLTHKNNPDSIAAYQHKSAARSNHDIFYSKEGMPLTFKGVYSKIQSLFTKRAKEYSLSMPGASPAKRLSDAYTPNPILPTRAKTGEVVITKQEDPVTKPVKEQPNDLHLVKGTLDTTLGVQKDSRTTLEKILAVQEERLALDKDLLKKKEKKEKIDTLKKEEVERHAAKVKHNPTPSSMGGVSSIPKDGFSS